MYPQVDLLEGLLQALHFLSDAAHLGRCSSVQAGLRGHGACKFQKERQNKRRKVRRARLCREARGEDISIIHSTNRLLARLVVDIHVGHVNRIQVLAADEQCVLF